MRTGLLGVATAIVMTAGAGAQEPPTWWINRVEVRDWTYVAENDDTLALVQTATPSVVNGLRRHWSRLEQRQPDSAGAVSSMTLVEYDCDGGRQRVIQRTDYAEQNLGSVLGTISLQSVWIYPMPGTIGASIFRAACAD